MSERRIPRFPDEREVDMWRLGVDKNGGGGDNHNLLSSTHTDTLISNPISGDLIIVNIDNKWARLPKGANGQVLKINNNLPTWENLVVISTSAPTITLPNMIWIDIS